MIGAQAKEVGRPDLAKRQVKAHQATGLLKKKSLGEMRDQVCGS